MKTTDAPLRLAAAVALCLSGTAALAQSVYYVCPGNVFTNTITAKEAEGRGCKAREAKEPTTIAGPRPKPVYGASGAARPGEGRVDGAEQRARDSDARKILEAELSKVIVGQADVIEQILIALFAGGHCLITGAPGLAKTLLVKSIARV